MITQYELHGGPFDGKFKTRLLRPDETTIQIALFTHVEEPHKTDQHMNIRRGHYVRTAVHEGHAVFHWKGFTT